MTNLKKGQSVNEFGQLFLCATPIGNLEDITLRVLRAFQEVDLIAAEDTRRTLRLLNHYGISKPLTSYYEHNQRQKGPFIIEQLLQGKKVALVSDAGMPGISDPGENLVQEALAAGVPVTVLPGPSAVLAALSLSGLSTRRFVFEGFLPRPRRERKQRIQELAGEPRTLVLFESPHRLLETLPLLLESWGPRKAAVVREVTKKFEEVIRGTLAEVWEHFKVEAPRGELVLVIEGQSILNKANDGVETSREGASSEAIEERIEELLDMVAFRAERGENPRDVLREIARKYNLSRRRLYQSWIKARNQKADSPSHLKKGES